jgi:dUTP pyrophosphatase
VEVLHGALLMTVKFKLFRNGKAPTYAKPDDAGMDLYAREATCLWSYEAKPIPVGVAVEVPKGNVGLVVGRSGLAAKHGIDIYGGVIDHGYIGEIRAIMFNGSGTPFYVEAGDRIAQLLIVPCIHATLEEVRELEETARGESGFGSTGVK